MASVPVFPLKMEAEGLFETARLRGKISISFLHCFGAIMLFSCHFYSIALLQKCIVVPFILFSLFHCVTSTSAREFLEKMTKLDSSNFFLTLFTAVLPKRV